jgi:U1 small nuclear ribonucleoprotein C
MNARKAHNTGRNHVANVRDYFASLGHDKAQSIIDQIISQHESGGRAVMMAAPSMRLGAGFMNPIMPPTSESTRHGAADWAGPDRGSWIVDLVPPSWMLSFLTPLSLGSLGGKPL